MLNDFFPNSDKPKIGTILLSGNKNCQTISAACCIRLENLYDVELLDFVCIYVNIYHHVNRIIGEMFCRITCVYFLI